MPRKLHEALKKSARKKGYKGKRAKKYIYGTMTKIEKKKAKKRGRSGTR